VEQAVAQPGRLSNARRAVAAELFHDPGRATERAIQELYAAMELDAPRRVHPVVAEAALIGAGSASSR